MKVNKIRCPKCGNKVEKVKIKRKLAVKCIFCDAYAFIKDIYETININ